MEKVYNFDNKGASTQSSSPDAKSFLLFQQKRLTTFLFKFFLNELEEMKDENLISEEYFKKQRKFILDSANSGMREFEMELDKFIIKFKG